MPLYIEKVELPNYANSNKLEDLKQLLENAEKELKTKGGTENLHIEYEWYGDEKVYFMTAERRE